jgi:hypothetical protein
MSNMQVPFISGDEQDALTRARHYLVWRAGVVRAIKTKYNRRARHVARAELRAELVDACESGMESRSAQPLQTVTAENDPPVTAENQTPHS